MHRKEDRTYETDHGTTWRGAGTPPNPPAGQAWIRLTCHPSGDISYRLASTGAVESHHIGTAYHRDGVEDWA